jgi:two-component system nitrogen regulation sensor histidine kinase GlnL
MNGMNGMGFEAIWGAMPYPALVIGPDDEIRAANPAAESFGAVSMRQMEGRPLGKFLGDDSAVLEVVRQARRSGVSVAQYDILVGWGDQAPQSQNIHAAPLHESEGAVLLLVPPLGMADKMDRSLGHRSAARSVTGMAAMLAHEIRNPLAGISGAAQLLEMGLGDADRELTSLIQA